MQTNTYYIIPFSQLTFISPRHVMEYCNNNVDCDEPFEVSAFDKRTNTRMPNKDYRWDSKWQRRATYGKWQDV